MVTTTTPNQNSLPDLLTPALLVQQDLNEIRKIMEPIDETIGTEILDFVSEVQCKYDTLKVESRVFALTLRTHINETLRGMVSLRQGDTHVNFNTLANEMTTASTTCFESFHQFADNAIESMMNLGAVVVAAEADMETTLKCLREGGNAMNTFVDRNKACEKIELSAETEGASNPDLPELQTSIAVLSPSSAKDVLELIETKVTFLLGKEKGEDSEQLYYQLSDLQERLNDVAVLVEKMFSEHESFVKSVSLMMGKFGTFIETWDLIFSTLTTSSERISDFDGDGDFNDRIKDQAEVLTRIETALEDFYHSI